MAVTQNLISIALTVVKAKSAAVHYETMVASHAFTGSDVGEFSHSRKQLNDILRCADAWCNREVSKYLCTSLPATKLPPHYYATCDKATPSRITNQAVMICPIVNGHRQAIAVSSPEVYNNANNEVEGDVSGATAPELAQMLFDEIKKAYFVEESVIRGAWMGTVCDGAYQAAEFASTLNAILHRDNLADTCFSCVLWDPAHFLDLAFKDVFEGKMGNSKEFVDRLVQRSCVVHKIFQRGKMLNHAMEMMTTDDNLVLKLTSRTCSTRFTTSQYVEFRKLLDSLPLYITTFRQFQYSEIKEYMVAGDDFLLDLCGICDILQPMLEMMVELQGLSVPCWKVVTWWPRLKSRMKQFEKKLSLKKPASIMPLLRKHAADIMSETFKGTKLVPGWFVVSSEITSDEKGNWTELSTWRVREHHDVESDLKAFLADVLESLEKRVAGCTKEIQNVLTCLDLDTIFGLLCGERLPNGKVKLANGEEVLELYGRKDFERFYTYVCSLPHIVDLAVDEELFLNAAFGNTIFHRMKQALKSYLWKDTGDHLAKWFSLSTPCQQRLMKLEKIDPSSEITVSCLSNTYLLTLEDTSGCPLKAKLNEAQVYHSIYTEESLFNEIGPEGCITIDIALAKGGTEAVVESYYSVMKSQKMFGGQGNGNLALRYIIV